MKLRRFNVQGINVFRERLSAMRQAPDAPVPSDLLGHSQLTELASPEIHIAVEYFQTKGEARSTFIQFSNLCFQRLSPQTPDYGPG